MLRLLRGQLIPRDGRCTKGMSVAVPPVAATGEGPAASCQPRLRIVTLNVHQFRDARCADSLDGIAAMLTAFAPDVVALQEVDRSPVLTIDPEIPTARVPAKSISKLQALCERTGLVHMTSNIPTMLGNAIISRWPLEDITHVTLTARGDHPRACTFASVTVPSFPAFTLMATHLNHMDEPTRIHQWKQITPHLSSRMSGPTLVCGDMNALSRRDYSDADWSEIARVRARGRWEAPQTDLIPLIYSSGLHDLYWAATRDEDPGEIKGKPAAFFRGERTTCAYNTRIDYVLSDDAWNSSYRMFGYRHVANKVTDHAMVVVDWELRIQPSGTPSGGAALTAAPAGAGVSSDASSKGPIVPRGETPSSLPSV